LLDVRIWVSMLATLLVSEETPMPISVGLFGEWGTGKSYFMGLLRSEIKRLSGSNRTEYLREIVQVGFNAWHYADTNLWASLADEIFRQLADSGTSADNRRQWLRAQLAEGLAERAALEARIGHAEEETVRLQVQLVEAEARRTRGAKDLLQALRNSPTFNDELRRMWRRLGVQDDTQQARLLYDEVRGAVDDAKVMRQLLGQQRSWVLAFVCVIALVAIAAATWIPANWGRWLASGGATVLALGLSVGLTWAARAKKAVTKLRAIASEVIRNYASAEGGAEDKAINRVIAELQHADADEKLARAQLDELVAHVGQLTRELSELMPGHRLYTFLAERAGSSVYAGQLGLISTIRKDFEQLVKLLDDFKRHVGDEPDRRPIDRIVLYIDDLDRCSARQVTDVLQAVHLLLALDLFVVVVGVDPRWLQRSLSQEYPSMFKPVAANGLAELAHPEVTPNDYLEKIFNLPFLLPGIPAGRLGHMLRGLTADSIEKNQPEPSQISRPADGEAGDNERAQQVLVEANSEVDINRSVEAEPPRPLTEPELTLLGRLQPFISTPRDAKRMLNLYRMLRSTRDLTGASAFLGDEDKPGEYQAVAMLLGMLTANARLLGKVLNASPQGDPRVAGGVAFRSVDVSWHAFVKDFDPTRSGDRWQNQIVGYVALEDVRAWQHFAAAAAQTSDLISLDGLTSFQRWAPIIQRFSFMITPSSSAL
jgi:hypothetical protein